MFSTLFQLMGMMFLIIGIGVILRKTGIITDSGKKSITNLILYAVLPGNIIKAFCTDLGKDAINKFFVILIIAILIQVLSLIISYSCYRKMPKNETPIYQYATVCSNSGFIGNPLAEGVFGSLGLIYASVFLIPQRIVMWTAGVSFFNTTDDRKSAYKKIVTHPCMVATYIGLIIMCFHIQLPVILMKTVTSLSNCCTALTMLYMGFILADISFKNIVELKTLYYCLIRLVGIPLLVYAFCFIFAIDPLVTGVCVLLSAMPAGSTTALLASKYNADEKCATKCVVLSTLLSLGSIPVWSMFLLSAI